MRVLDLGSGRGASSVLLAREHDVGVWSVDLWFPARERQRRAEGAGVGGRVHALRADARSLPFAAEFFDAVVAIDCFGYVGTDDLYLPLLLRRVKKPGAGSAAVCRRAYRRRHAGRVARLVVLARAGGTGERGRAGAVATDAGDVLTYTRVVAERTATPVRSPVATIEVDYIDVPLMAADVAQTGLGD